MQENILPTAPPAPSPKKKIKVSWMTVVFIIILTIVLIILGEIFLNDLNRWINPAYGQYGSSRYSTGLFNPTVAQMPTKTYDKGDYEAYRLGIHAAFIIPVFLAAFLLYFLMYYKKERTHKSIVALPYFIFALWMTLHLVLETFYFLIEQYKTAGVYVVLIVLAALLTWLVIFIQKKIHEKKEAKL